jgi:hypothetical protein
VRPSETLDGLLSYLELDGRDETIQALLSDQADNAPAWSSVHRTSRDPEASIGRWRSDLSPELRNSCREAFGFALELFGYPIDDEEQRA